MSTPTRSGHAMRSPSIKTTVRVARPRVNSEAMGVVARIKPRPSLRSWRAILPAVATGVSRDSLRSFGVPLEAVADQEFVGFVGDELDFDQADGAIAGADDEGFGLVGARVLDLHPGHFRFGGGDAAEEVLCLFELDGVKR